MSEEQHPFQPGVKVAIFERPELPLTAFSEARVSSAHSTGRFVIDGSREQWKPIRGMGGEYTAYPCKEDRWPIMRRVQLLASTLKAIEENNERKVEFSRLISRIAEYNGEVNFGKLMDARQLCEKCFPPRYGDHA